MKKIYFLLIATLIVSLAFSQGKYRNDSFLSAVKVEKGEYNLPSAKAVIDSLHYDGANGGNAIGTGGAADFGVYAFFPASALAGHNSAGNTITSVKVFINGVTDVAATELRIYSDTSTMVYNQTWTAVEGWNEVVLTTPLAIPTTDLYIGYNLTATGGYPAGCDDGPVNPNGNWMYFGGWAHLTDLAPTLTYNWNIRAMVDGTMPTIPVAACTPLAWNAGAIETNSSITSGTFTLSNSAGGTLTVTSATDLSATPFSTTFTAGAVNLTAGQTYDFTFSFDPTIDGTYNETFTVVTNGGTINITLDGMAYPPCTIISSYPYTEGFEGAVFPPLCWTMNDADGDTYNWEVRDTSWGTHSGMYCAVSSSWMSTTGALTPDNYFITPQFDITAANLELKFWTAAQDPSYPSDYYSVLVSTTGTAPGDFTEIYNETIPDDVWNEKTLSLSAYNGQQIYIAFRHYNCTDWFYMKLDDVSIDYATSVNDINESNVNIFPNPTTGTLNISNIENANVVVYNTIGEVVLSLTNVNRTIDVSELAEGTYVVKVVTENNVITEKVTLVK